MHRQMFSLLIVSFSFLILLFFYSFGTSFKTSIFIDFQQQKNTIMVDSFSKSAWHKTDDEPYIFSKYGYLNETRKPTENVIAFLVPSFSGDVRLAYNPYPKLRERILQLDERLGDNRSTDVIIFHTGYPFVEDLFPITDCTPRQVEFVNVDHVFYKFSPGFEPHTSIPLWTQKGKWNYHHMCYFWFKQVFELKIIRRYRYMMRLDDDSLILGNWPNVFDLMAKNHALYFANKRETDNEWVLPGLTLVRNLTAAFIIKNKINVQNPVMLLDIFNHTMELPNYWNNIEAIDVSLMQRKEVLDFVEAVDQSRGIFLHRWGDAVLRFITLALFTNASQVLHREELGLDYCHPC